MSSPVAHPWLVFVAIAAGCTSHRVDTPLATTHLAAADLELSAGGHEVAPDRWWTSFGDPALDATVDEALTTNFDVHAALARLDAAEANVRIRRSALFPAVEAFASSSTGTDARFDGVQRVPGELGLGASYELDLWGRIRAEVRGQARRREVTRADAETAALSVAGATVSTWIAIAATQEQLRLLDDQIVANEQMAAIVRSRMLNGVVRQADSLRQDRLVEQTRTERIARAEDLDVLRHRLAMLLGRPPRDVPAALPGSLPEAPALPATGLASELLLRRPDVVAAHARVEAADADVAVAVTELYPRFTLRADVSNAPASPEALITGWVASIGARLVAPLFEGGRRRAEVTRTRALLEASVADYGARVLDALREVEDALVRNRRQEETVTLIDRQVALASQTADNLQLQYVGGLGVGYLDVLTAQSTAQQLRRQQIAARQRLLENRVELFRTLAGGVVPGEVDDG